MPTAEEKSFDTGADLTPTLGAHAALIEQAIELALPSSYRGMVIYSETTPASTGQPSGYATNWYQWHRRCLWFKPSTGEIFQFNGTTWALGVAKPGTGTIINAMIVDGTIQIAKLSTAGGTPLQVLQVNTPGTGFQFATLANALANASVATNKLISGLSGSKYLASNGTTVTWEILDSATLLALFGSNEIPPDYLTRGSANQVLTTNAAGTAVIWAAPTSAIADYSLALQKVAKVVGDTGKYLQYDATGELKAVTLAIPTPVGTVFASSSEVATGTEASKAIAPVNVKNINGLLKASGTFTIVRNAGPGSKWAADTTVVHHNIPALTTDTTLAPPGDSYLRATFGTPLVDANYAVLMDVVETLPYETQFPAITIHAKTTTHFIFTWLIVFPATYTVRLLIL